MSYSSYDHDDLEPASTMRIERRIYFESGKADLSEAVKLPLAELLSLRAESAAAEQEVFDRLKEQAVAWVSSDKLFEMFRLKQLHPLITYVDQLIG